MFNFVCKDCGAIQTPINNGKHFNTFGTKCQKCGGELMIKKTGGKNVNSKKN